jgi:dTDP-4-amino-4,6-dideoxygalactose transaminase
VKLGTTMIVPHSRPSIDQEDIEAVAKVLASGNIAQGKKVREFENELARYVGTKHAIACSSGTAALHLALTGLGVKNNDEIIIPSYVCASPYFATLHIDAKPRIVDVDQTDLNICSETVKARLTQKVKAIIVPHMFGNPAELDELLELGIPLIEDCAQALGAEYHGQKVGKFGDLSIFSFYATKMITTGEGGMILTNNKEFYANILDIRNYDKKPLKPVKYNYKMTDFQATLGLSQLKKLQQFIARRRQIAAYYDEQFSNFNLTPPHKILHKKSVFYRYVMTVNKLHHIRKAAKEKGVICEKPVWKPLHKLLSSIKCPNSDYALSHTLSVPLYPSLKEEEAEYVAKTLNAIFKETNPSIRPLDSQRNTQCRS